MNKILFIISTVLLAQFSFAAHHEAGEKHATVIGYETSDEGTQMDIHAGNLSAIDIWVNYVEAHNTRDLAAINAANTPDFKGWAANGVIIDGAVAHAAFLKEWFAASNPKWKYKYAIANDVPQEDGSVNRWVTSSYTLTDIIDGKEVTSEEMYDVRIENGKIKNIYVAARAVIAAE
jgi:hypothetical protein|tara:strand:+ start:358 stop:885 length:528 start_codon:yes stop_codon:yes gene_type:complete